MEFSRQENWSGLPFPPPGELPHPGIGPGSLAFSGGFFTTEPPAPRMGRPKQLRLPKHIYISSCGLSTVMASGQPDSHGDSGGGVLELVHTRSWEHIVDRAFQLQSSETSLW